MEICFDASWTLTFLPFHASYIHVSTAKELDECAPRTQQLMATKQKKGRSLQPCPRVVQVKIGGGFKYLLFSPLPGEMIQFD